MKVWVDTRFYKQPEFSVLARYGASYMQVGYWRTLDQWRWLQPYGVEEKIAEPEQIFVDEEWALANKLDKPRGVRVEKASLIRRKKGEAQLLFEL